MIQDSRTNFQDQQFRSLPLTLKPEEEDILVKLINSSTIAQSILVRAKIILYSAMQLTTYRILKILNITWKTAQKWIHRWQYFTSELSKVKDMSNYNLTNLIINCLSDASRKGRSAIFTQEQILKIMNLACTTPETLGISLSHWSSRSLAMQVVSMKIVPKISHERISFF